MPKKSKKTQRGRNADRNQVAFQQFIKFSIEIWDRYLRAIASLDLELVDGGSILYPNIALFVRTGRHYILELLGSCEVYHGLSVKTHTEPDIHKYLYQFEFKMKEEVNPIIKISSNLVNSGLVDLVLSGPATIEEFEKRFGFILPYKQGDLPLLSTLLANSWGQHCLSLLR